MKDLGKLNHCLGMIAEFDEANKSLWLHQKLCNVRKIWAYCSNPYLTAVKRIFRYLKETIDLGLKYEKSDPATLTGYSDAD